MDIGILGAGAWGTALATVVARNGHTVQFWDPVRDIIDNVNSKHQHPFALPGIKLDDKIMGVEQVENVAKKSVLLLALPSQAMRLSLEKISNHVSPNSIMLVCSKGIELETGALMTDLVKDLVPQASVAVLSGPTFASEVACGLPTAVTLASKNSTVSGELVKTLSRKEFRMYLTNDLVGTQVTGSVKNVLAIACGISDGRSYGDNARSSVITRGIAEVGRLNKALGGKADTLMGPSGVGDIVLTCTSKQSRNYSLGHSIGSSRNAANVIQSSTDTVEGVATAASVAKLSAKHGINMPITEAVNKVLHHGADIDTEIAQLLTRPISN